MIDTTITNSATTLTIGLLGRPGERREDPDRQRLLRAGGEDRHDDLVEREREREQAAGEQRRAHLREQSRSGRSATSSAPRSADASSSEPAVRRRRAMTLL